MPELRRIGGLIDTSNLMVVPLEGFLNDVSLTRKVSFRLSSPGTDELLEKVRFTKSISTH